MRRRDEAQAEALGARYGARFGRHGGAVDEHDAPVEMRAFDAYPVTPVVGAVRRAQATDLRCPRVVVRVTDAVAGPAVRRHHGHDHVAGGMTRRHETQVRWVLGRAAAWSARLG